MPLVEFTATLAMVDSEGLQAIFNRLESGKRLGKPDLRILVTAVRSQQVTIATGDRAVAIGGSADGAVIVTGDRNIIITGADAEAISELMGTRPRTERLLLQAVKEEVTSRLKQSLHNQVLIQLGMEAQPEHVKRPWDSEIKIGDKPPEPIPEDWNILQVFDEAQGKLLILGAPGAGKTTMVLDLARELCIRAEQQADYPIPVLLNLSTWKGAGNSIQNWLVKELKSKYGVRRDVGIKWLNNAELLLILDGLDEVESAFQMSCIQAINQLRHEEYHSQYLVVCSRYEEYNNTATKLQLNGAVFLQQLSNTQIQNYLIQLQQDVLSQILQKDSILLELVRKPLLLSIAILSGRKLLIQNWQQLSSENEQLSYLLDTYVQQMWARKLKNSLYNRSKHPTTIVEFRKYLVFLAQRLQQESKTEFLIENIQPIHWLNDQQILIYRIIVGLIIGVIIGLLMWLVYSLKVGVIIGTIVGLIHGLAHATDNIEPAEKFQLSWSKKAKEKVIKNLFVGLLFGFTSGVIIGVFAGLISGLNFGLGLGAAFGLVGMAVHGIIGGLIRGFTGAINIKSYPNQGIWESAKNIVVISIVTLPIGLLVYVLPFFIRGVQLTLIKVPLGAIAFAIVFGFSSGGVPCIEHLALRVLLYFDKYIPWNYAGFLDHCTDRLFLQRVGGRYRFIHRLLQEHFAAMPLQEGRSDR